MFYTNKSPSKGSEGQTQLIGEKSHGTGDDSSFTEDLLVKLTVNSLECIICKIQERNRNQRLCVGLTGGGGVAIPLFPYYFQFISYLTMIVTDNFFE